MPRSSWQPSCGNANGRHLAVPPVAFWWTRSANLDAPRLRNATLRAHTLPGV
jgi:hypothetical protein